MSRIICGIIFFVSCIALAGVIKETKQDEPIVVITNDGGTMKEVARFSSSNGLSGSGYAAKNEIANGDFETWERNTCFDGSGGTCASAFGNTAGYTADKWYVGAYRDSSGTIKVNRDTTVPSTTDWTSNYSMKVSVGTTETFSSTDLVFIQNTIEGIFLKPFAGKTVTFSFWVRSNITGAYGAAFKNSADNRTYPTTFTINSADTWEKKSITFTHDKTGTWDYGNGLGIRMSIVLVAGSSRQTSSLNTWNGDSLMGHSSMVQTWWTGTNNFYISQVRLNEGSVSQSYQYFGGDYSSERNHLLRYYYKDMPGSGNLFNVRGVQANYMGCSLPVLMRATPTISISGTKDTHYGVRDYSGGALTGGTFTEGPKNNAFPTFYFNGQGAGNSANIYVITGSPYIEYSADL